MNVHLCIFMDVYIYIYIYAFSFIFIIILLTGLVIFSNIVYT